jgi:SAM-dependent methyltransferase
VRALLRYRDSLVKMAAAHVQHMQKASTQMNLQLHHVISDITGQTGLAILDAILAGERDPEVLAQLRYPSIKASKETVVRSLQGDWRPEHLFTLRQALGAYRYYQHLLVECDGEMERQLQELDSRLELDPRADPPRKRIIPGNQLRFASLNLATELYRILGVDLTRVPGLDTLTDYTLFSEVSVSLAHEEALVQYDPQWVTSQELKDTLVALDYSIRDPDLVRGFEEQRAEGMRIPVKLHQCPAEALPFPDASLDMVISTLVLCTAKDAPKSLAEVKRVLKPDGTLRFMKLSQKLDSAGFSGSTSSPRTERNRSS